jgi:pimeloyl-ACP methyl ester carboxylesterase
MGTGLDSESPRMKKLGALDLTENMLPVITQVTAPADSGFSLPADFPKNTLTLAFGANTSDEDVSLFTPGMTKTYSGDEGRLRLRQSAIALLSRDSLHLRLSAITCPVLWIQGSEDKVFPIDGVKEELGLLGSKNAKLETISGGPHVSSWAHAAEVNKLVGAFVATYGGKEDARKLREAVGMVEM